MKVFLLIIGIFLIVLVAILAVGCGTPLEPAPLTQSDVCPTGCQIPPGCHAELSPPNHPKGYVLLCP